MVADEIRFYLDENVHVEIARQLVSRGIDAVTVRDLGLLGDNDDNHLQRATEMGRVLCTHDSDFVELAASGTEHAGIVFGQQEIHGVGDWVKFLTLMHAVYAPDDMLNMVEYL
ncbi:MAG: DUF5615 family PIN-like protein [Chloroflexota bacterium]